MEKEPRVGVGAFNGDGNDAVRRFGIDNALGSRVLFGISLVVSRRAVGGESDVNHGSVYVSDLSDRNFRLGSAGLEIVVRARFSAGDYEPALALGGCRHSAESWRTERTGVSFGVGY